MNFKYFFDFSAYTTAVKENINRVRARGNRNAAHFIQCLHPIHEVLILILNTEKERKQFHLRGLVWKLALDTENLVITLSFLLIKSFLYNNFLRNQGNNTIHNSLKYLR